MWKWMATKRKIMHASKRMLQLAETSGDENEKSEIEMKRKKFRDKWW